jgi:hypothetical protein
MKEVLFNCVVVGLLEFVILLSKNEGRMFWVGKIKNF